MYKNIILCQIKPEENRKCVKKKIHEKTKKIIKLKENLKFKKNYIKMVKTNCESICQVAN